MKKIAILWLVLLLLCVGVWTAACAKSDNNPMDIISGQDDTPAEDDSETQEEDAGDEPSGQQDSEDEADTQNPQETPVETAAPEDDGDGPSESTQEPTVELTSELAGLDLEGIKNLARQAIYNFEDGTVLTVEKPELLLALVNKKNDLPSDYVPSDLAVPEVPFPFEDFDPKMQLRREAADALELLFAASVENGLELFAQSGYRSYDRQTSIYGNNVAKMGEEEANKVSAQPGQSEHQSGLAMDVTCADVGYDLVEEFGETEEGLWLKDNAHLYGFIIRYPQDKVDITQYNFEPWHLRYVGTVLATELYSNGMTLDEFYVELN